ncbi:hypothetical protein CBL_20944 [Carabus blaptoides fortunei]
MFAGIQSSLKNIGNKAESLFEKKKSDAGEIAEDTTTESAKVLEETGEAMKAKGQGAKDGVDKFINDTAREAEK